MTDITVTGIDHIYIAVSDIDRAERFYDDVMRLLDFRKGTKPIGGDKHCHYFNPVVQYSIRPARPSKPAHDPYSPGLHHLCFRVGSMAEVDAVAHGLIEEEDFTGSLGETLYQVARRVQRQAFSSMGRESVNAAVDQIGDALRAITSEDWETNPRAAYAAERLPGIVALRDRTLRTGAELPAVERGAILALLGSAERAFVLIERIDAERRSVARVVPADAVSAERGATELGRAAPMPA